MATLNDIATILQKAKSGQYVSLKCNNTSSDFDALVVQLGTDKILSTKAETWEEGWPQPSEEPDPEDTTAWGQLVLALENSNGGTVAYKGTTLEEGGAITDVKYRLDDNDPTSIIDTTWINLGYNASIPEYVKYRRAVGTGYKRVWVSSLKNGMLSAIAVGDQCYTRTFSDETLNHTYTASEGETVTAIGSETFTYGNNCTYSVPKTITTSKGTYEFCGYNVTLNQRDIMLDTTPNLSAAYTCVYFDKDNSSNRYSQAAKLRSFLNDKTGSADGYYDDSSCESSEDYTIKSLVDKVSSGSGFLKNITKTVNRTWVYGTDASSFECVSDRFWLLGMGNIKCTGKSDGTEYFHDTDKDTSKFNYFGNEIDMFIENDSRVKHVLTTSGSSGDAFYWWLRSAHSGYSDGAGGVYDDGSVSGAGGDYYGGVASACLIG